MPCTRLVVSFICLAGFAGQAMAQDPVSITYKPLKLGEVVRTRTSTSVVGTMSGVGPATQNMSQKSDQWMKMECLDVDATGATTVRLTFERMAMTMNVGPIAMSYDSADRDASTSQPAINPMGKILDAMIGKSITVRTDPQGKPLEIKGLQEVMNSVFQEMPGGQQMAKMMESIFSDNAVMEKFGNIASLPDKPVRIGDTWPSQQDMKMGPLGNMVMKSKNKLLGIETVNGRRCARVAMTTNMELGNTDKPYEINGTQVQMHMTSTGGTGSWLWDIDRGRMIQMKTVAPMEMTISGQPPASQSQPSDDFKMVQKMTHTTIMEEIEGDPTRIDRKASTTQPTAERSTPEEMTSPATQAADRP